MLLRHQSNPGPARTEIICGALRRRTSKRVYQAEKTRRVEGQPKSLTDNRQAKKEEYMRRYCKATAKDNYCWKQWPCSASSAHWQGRGIRTTRTGRVRVHDQAVVVLPKEAPAPAHRLLYWHTLLTSRIIDHRSFLFTRTSSVVFRV